MYMQLAACHSFAIATRQLKTCSGLTCSASLLPLELQPLCCSSCGSVDVCLQAVSQTSVTAGVSFTLQPSWTAWVNLTSFQRHWRRPDRKRPAC